MNRRGEGFLKRWSRRKLRAALSSDDRAKLPDAPASAAADIAPSPKNALAITDPDQLPALESLDASSDFTPFLAPGVPAELAREALRRAWTTDPAIRNFIGLAENTWDFTAADGIPGFGSLSAEDAARLLAQLMPPDQSTDRTSPASGANAPSVAHEGAHMDIKADEADRAAPATQARRDTAEGAVQQERGASAYPLPIPEARK